MKPVLKIDQDHQQARFHIDLTQDQFNTLERYLWGKFRVSDGLIGVFTVIDEYDIGHGCGVSLNMEDHREGFRGPRVIFHRDLIGDQLDGTVDPGVELDDELSIIATARLVLDPIISELRA